MEQLLCDFTRRLLITTLMRSNTWMYGKPNQTIPDGKTCWWLKGLTDTSKFVETWKPQELMERSSKLKKPGNSWTLSFSHAILNFSPGVCVYHPCFPKDILRPCISPMEGWNCQSRIQRTEETWLKPTLCSASILEIPHRHRNYPKQIRLDMLSTNTKQRTFEGSVETIGYVLLNLQEKAYAFGINYLVLILRKLESSHVSLRDEKILETSLAKFEKILVTHDRDEKWKCFGIASELEIFGTNWLIILLWMQRLQKKDK